MADTKITALTALTAADPANDVIPIVDVSDTSMAASGTTKKISVNNILGASGTATLASATITGDLTVRTTGLTTTASAVGINTASPTANTLTIGASRYILCSDSQSKFGDNGIINGAAADANTQIQYFGGKALFFNEGVATRMTLNSTGLGLGVSPVTALSFPIGTTKIVAQSAVTAHLAGNAGTLKFGISDGGGDYSGLHVVNSHNGTYSSQDLLFFTGEGGVTLSLERMRITRSGDLILQAPSTPPTLTVNGQLTVNATSNTNLRFSYRGSDGTTRVANITLA